MVDQPGGSGTSTGKAERILIVDDVADTRLVVASALNREGFEVDQAGGGEAALAMIDRHGPDLVLLDINMPGMSGLDVMRELRAHQDIPVILVTGLDQENDRVAGLDLGADDYITKPFFAKELAARVRAVLRRAKATPTPQRPPRVQEFGPLVICLAERKVTIGGCVVEMTTKELDLLAYLASSPPTVFSRQQLLDAVWGSSSDRSDPATVTEHVRRVRKKIEDEPEAPAWLITVRGVATGSTHQRDACRPEEEPRRRPRLALRACSARHVRINICPPERALCSRQRPAVGLKRQGSASPF